MQNRAEINFNHCRHFDQTNEEMTEDTKEFLEKEHVYYERLRGVLEGAFPFEQNFDGRSFRLAETIIDRQTGEFDPAGVQAMCLVLLQEFEKEKKLANKIEKMKWATKLFIKEADDF